MKQEKLQKINTFHIQQLAYILEQMQSIREDEGTLLDNRVLVYGAGISDGDRHDNYLGRPADPAGGQGRGYDQVWAARGVSEPDSDDEPVLEHVGPDGRAGRDAG